MDRTPPVQQTAPAHQFTFLDVLAASTLMIMILPSCVPSLSTLKLSCVDDADCVTGQVCVDEVCVSAIDAGIVGEGEGEGEGEAACEAIADPCDDGLDCTSDDVCAPDLTCHGFLAPGSVCSAQACEPCEGSSCSCGGSDCESCSMTLRGESVQSDCTAASTCFVSALGVGAVDARCAEGAHCTVELADLPTDYSRRQVECTTGAQCTVRLEEATQGDPKVVCNTGADCLLIARGANVDPRIECDGANTVCTAVLDGTDHIEWTTCTNGASCAFFGSTNEFDVSITASTLVADIETDTDESTIECADGSDCSLTIRQADSPALVDVDCRNNGSAVCEVDCAEATRCRLECPDDNPPSCSLVCAGPTVTCSGGERSCNADDCP